MVLSRLSVSCCVFFDLRQESYFSFFHSHKVESMLKSLGKERHKLLKDPDVFISMVNVQSWIIEVQEYAKGKLPLLALV